MKTGLNFIQRVFYCATYFDSAQYDNARFGQSERSRRLWKCFPSKFNHVLIILLLFPIVVFAQGQLLDSLSLVNAKEFTNLDSALKTPDEVIRLVLRKNKLKEIPKEIFQFTNLQYLDLSKNKIKEIPEDIGKLQNLQKLILSRNNIEVLPKEIGMLKNLTELNVNQNDLISIPSQIASLENLVYLDLWSNNLSGLPDEIGNLKKLRELDLRVILLDDSEQERIKELLPKTTIYFSPSCKCKQ